MKRALLLAGIVALGMSLVAAAGNGFYWEFKQGLTVLEAVPGQCEIDCASPPAWFELGLDFELGTNIEVACPQTDPCGIVQDTIEIVLDGTFYIANANIWTFPQPYVAGVDFGFDWGNWGFDFVTEVDFLANYNYWPNFVGLDDWTLNAEVQRYFDSSYLAFGFDIIYRHFDPVGAWQMWPYIDVKMYFNGS